jgi:hypothetical protein
MSALTENEIMDIVYTLYETDNTGWDTDSAEYLSGRAFGNAAIRLWERYKNSVWSDLWSTLTAAADGTKTLTAGTYAYTCPTNFRRPASWVRTVDTNGAATMWEVIKPQRVAELVDSQENWCYFTGSVKDGFTLHFNSEITLTTGDTINYEYYKTATLFTAITSTTEVSDPYFIVYYILARFLKNDGEDYGEEKQQWMELLDNMWTENITGYFGISDSIPIVNKYGFGA